MTPRVQRLREESYRAKPTISHERAEIITEFYKDQLGKVPIPILRALSFRELCAKQRLYIGADEWIVGERGPFPKAVPTFPELTCHSLNDLQVLNDREMTAYHVPPQVFEAYKTKVIPFWEGRSMRDRLLPLFSEPWHLLYEAGVFTEFMEQRAPGHTTLDGRIYQKGIKDWKQEIRDHLNTLDRGTDPHAYEKQNQLMAMEIACDAIILFAHRHSELANQMTSQEKDPKRREELRTIARVCARVPEHAPQDLHEALQTYWFLHLGTIMELNGWDAMNPGHLDQHLYPFYQNDLEEGRLTQEEARELISCLWIKFNNQPAPPKVGVTAQESGTYNDFTNINLGGLLRNGSDGVNDLSYLLLDIAEEVHLLQPGFNIQISQKSPQHFLERACAVIARGFGYPSVFNSDLVVQEMVGMGKTLEDAREGGTSGCIETGAFGKEAYILTGYLNLPKILELTLNQGIDRFSGKQVGLSCGDPNQMDSFDLLYRAFEKQLNYAIHIKMEANHLLEQAYVNEMPAPFLSVLIADCIQKGKDYYQGGARYNTHYIQCCGIGTVTDSLSALQTHVYERKDLAMGQIIHAMNQDFCEEEPLRQLLWNHTPFFGNDDPQADHLMERVFCSLFEMIDGKPDSVGGKYHINFLSTTCHVYFGTKTGATPNGRHKGLPISDGTSPSHGADRNGPTAVIRSLSRMDQAKTGGTLLNQRFSPSLFTEREGIQKIAHLIRSYFRQGGHHIQFNVVDTKTLRSAQKDPEQYADLLVRVAGYSDYFIHLDRLHQEEIISRTLQEQEHLH